MLGQNNTKETAAERVPSKSPLLSLPAEIRNRIYYYVVVPLGGVVTLRGPEDAKVDWQCTHPIHTALLRTSRQIYQEASTLLYGGIRFLYDWIEYESFTGGDYSPSVVPLKLIQNLEVSFFISYQERTSEGICRFLKVLVDQQCSFNRLTLLYDHTSSGVDDLLELGTHAGDELSDLTCAVEVRRELEIVFFLVSSEECEDEMVFTLTKDYIKNVAVGKSWIATESYERRKSSEEVYDPEYTVRYLLHPGEAALKNTK